MYTVMLCCQNEMNFIECCLCVLHCSLLEGMQKCVHTIKPFVEHVQGRGKERYVTVDQQSKFDQGNKQGWGHVTAKLCFMTLHGKRKEVRMFKNKTKSPGGRIMKLCVSFVCKCHAIVVCSAVCSLSVQFTLCLVLQKKCNAAPIITVSKEPKRLH